MLQISVITLKVPMVLHQFHIFFWDELGEGEEVRALGGEEERLLALPLASGSLIFAGEVGADWVLLFF